MRATKSYKNKGELIIKISNLDSVDHKPLEMIKSFLHGKTAIVTGSTSGIGLAISKSLASRGANIMLNGFGDKDTAIEEIRSLGVQVDYHSADMSKSKEIEHLVRTTEERFGAVDILCNNAGIQHVARVDTFPAEKWESIIAINLSSAFYATHYALPGMKMRNWGRIINVASVHGLVASAEKSAYVAAKHGVVGLTKVTALELARTGITANAICPGWVLTPLVQKQVEARAQRDNVSLEAAKDALLSEKQPSGQFVKPEQLGALAVFLCGEDASEVRGVAWNMDGGWVAQ